LQASADPERLHQVFFNLIDNAIRHGRQGGQAAVAAHLIEGGGVEVRVVDDGPGVPAEALARVFERFFRVDRARSREQGGTGLGLAIVKHLVLAHGGKVWAQSEPGQGAVFCFTLPPAPDKSPPAATAA
jgi:signal transduction histidine kinase